MTEPLDTERGDFTVTVEYDVKSASSPHDAVALAVHEHEFAAFRVVKITREYVPNAAG